MNSRPPDAASADRKEVTREDVQHQFADWMSRHGLQPSSTHKLLARWKLWMAARPAESEVFHTATAARTIADMLDFLIEQVGFDAAGALQLLEAADPSKMWRRHNFLKFLWDPRCPAYTHREMRHLLAELAEHGAANKDSLTATGYPRSRFSKSPWLDWRLTDLNRIKIPFHAELATSPVSGAPEYVYHWAAEAVGWPLPRGLDLGAPFVLPTQQSADLPTDAEGAQVERVWTEVSYPQASPIRGLDADECSVVEKDRPRFFGMRAAVLEVVRDAFVTGEGEGLVERCFAEIAAVLSEKQFGYYSAFDHILSEGRAKGAGKIGPACGGIHTLLMAVGHCEIELRVGSLSTARNRVAGLLRIDENGRKAFVRDMYPCREEEWHRVDDAIEDYNRRVSNIPAWEENICERINRAQRTQLRNPVTVTAQVARKHKDRFERVVRSYTEGLRDEIADDLLEISATMEPASPHREIGWIARKGNSYRFLPPDEDEFSILVDSTAGIHTIVMLIMNKGTAVPWRRLDMIESSGDPHPLREERAGAAPAMDEEHGGDKRCEEDKGFVGERADERAIADVDAEKKKLQVELKDARRRGDKTRVRAVQEQLKPFRRYLMDARGPKGKPRQDITASEKAGRKRTIMRIKRAISRIAKTNDEVARLIDASIQHKNGEWIYVPVREPGWRVQNGI